MNRRFKHAPDVLEAVSIFKPLPQPPALRRDQDQGMHRCFGKALQVLAVPLADNKKAGH